MERTVTEARLAFIRLACPHLRMETVDGVTWAIIPHYNAETDVISEFKLRVIADSDEPKFKPGDTLRHTQTGATFDIVEGPDDGPSLRPVNRNDKSIDET